MGRSVGRRSVKRKRPVQQREVSLFDFSDDIEASHPFVDDVETEPFADPFIDDNDSLFDEPARTTRDLTTVAITVPLAGVAIGTLGTL